MACNKHKQRKGGKVVPVFNGLAAEVESLLSRFENIDAVKCGTVRKYHGNSKVQIEPWYAYKGKAVVYVCDKQYGECQIIIFTRHRGPILNHLQRALKKGGIAFDMLPNPNATCAGTGRIAA